MLEDRGTDNLQWLFQRETRIQLAMKHKLVLLPSMAKPREL